MDIFILVGIMGIVTAGIGIVFVFRALGYFEYLGGKNPLSDNPSPKQNLQKDLLALNDSTRPYFIRPGKDSDLIAEWKLVDAEWYGIFNKNKLESAYRAALLLDESRHSVRCYEEFGQISWSVGLNSITPSVHYSKSFFGGRIYYKKEYAKGYGLKQLNPPKPGKVYDYTFDVNEIRGLLILTVEANGWEWVPVAGKRNTTFSSLQG